MVIIEETARYRGYGTFIWSHWHKSALHTTKIAKRLFTLA
jgi:hypothetical protein